MVEFDVHNLQKIKMFVHIAQSFFILVAWAVEIAVFKGADKIDGRPGWYFGLVGNLPFHKTSANNYPVFPHDTCNHLPHNDTSIPSNSQTSKSIRNGMCGRPVLHPLDLCIRITSKLQFKREVQGSMRD
jgi:hypothetical protein